MSQDLIPCDFCGMPCEPREYHPYAACLMFKACGDSKVVRANLQAVIDHGASPAASQEAAAWLHEEDPTRVISQAQKVQALRDGGASASSVRAYSIPLPMGAKVLAPRPDGAPPEIWLQLHGDQEPDGTPADYTADVSWCWHQVHEHDVRYVLAPPVSAAEKGGA